MIETEKTTVAEIEVLSTETEHPAEEKEPVKQKTPKEECTEEVIITEPEETVKCIDEGHLGLAEYKPTIGDQPNPFENNTPTEIDDRPVEGYIGKGDDRPGEGKHF